jgi:hypothetical protein
MRVQALRSQTSRPPANGIVFQRHSPNVSPVKAAFFTGLLFCALKIGAVESDHSHAVLDPSVKARVTNERVDYVALKVDSKDLDLRYSLHRLWSLNDGNTPQTHA